MSSGTIYLSEESNMKAKITWEYSSNSLMAILWVKKLAGTPTLGTWKWWIAAHDNDSVGGDWYGSIGEEYVQVGILRCSVYSSSVYLEGMARAPSGTSLAGQECIGGDLITLYDPEPEYTASTITDATNASLGGNSNVLWTPDNAALWYKLSYPVNNGDGSTTEYATKYNPNTTAPYTAQLLMRYELAKQIPGTSGQVTLTLTTHTSSACNSSDQVGSADTETITVTVPDNDNTKPVVTAAAFAPSPDPFEGPYIQSVNGIQVTGVTASGKYGATITDYHFRVEGKNYGSAQEYTSDAFVQSGSITVTAFAVDSRGFTSQGYPFSVNVIPYSKPKLKAAQGQNRPRAERCDEDGTLNDKGTWLKILARREYSPVVYEEAQKNFCAIRFRYKPDTVDGWSDWTVILAAEAAGDEIITEALLGTLSSQITYLVELQAVDTLEETGSTIITVSTEKVYDHANGDLGSYGFGEMVSEPDVFSLAEAKLLRVRGQLVLLGDAYRYLLDICHPIGSVLETVTAANPADTIGGTWAALGDTENTHKWRRTE